MSIALQGLRTCIYRVSDIKKATESYSGGIIVGAIKDLWGNIFGIIYNPTFTLH